MTNLVYCLINLLFFDIPLLHCYINLRLSMIFLEILVILTSCDIATASAILLPIKSLVVSTVFLIALFDKF